VELLAEKCPICGSQLITQYYKYDENDYYIIQFCSNPKCPYEKPVIAMGRIPREIAERYFPGAETL
jgi:hypothetical protein